MASYEPPLSLVIIGTIFIILGLLGSVIIAIDIVNRRGWRSMMGIMSAENPLYIRTRVVADNGLASYRIPVYLLNALYLAPITLWTYFNYGRAIKPEPKPANAYNCGEQTQGNDRMDNAKGSNGDHMDMSSRPMFATVTVAVCHCGAGCLLGDIVGEFLVYGTNAKINGHHIWVELLVDYGFALFFGIIFQYFSIAPMSGQYGLGSLWRALKADILSLTAFQVGLYGWMAIYQVAIWDYKLEIPNVVYWWMMQVGMFLGHWTAVPMNWLLIRYNVKEPCA